MSVKKGRIQDQLDQAMLDQRKVFLWGGVDDDSAKHVIDRMLYLDAQGHDEIQLVINSPGGYVTSGFAIYDTIKSLKSPVSTICSGLAASMGSILLSVGAPGRRFIQPHARVMIHQPLGGFQGQASDIEIHAKEILYLKDKLNRILSTHTGQKIENVAKDTDRDNFMSADDAVKFGLVDQVISKR